MKKKIVIHVPMHSGKAKSKAMKIAVAIQGVISVSIGGEDELVVIGEGVDSVCLSNSLRKKFCFADIVTLEEVKPPPPPPSPDVVPDPKPDPGPCPPLPCYLPPVYCPPPYYDADPHTCCTM